MHGVKRHCLVYRLLVFVKTNGCGLDFEKRQTVWKSVRLKFDNDVIIKLGRVARLWNGPSLRGHNRRNGEQNFTFYLDYFLFLSSFIHSLH